MDFLKNNYMRGIGHGNTWKVEIDPPTRKVKTYFEETVNAIEHWYSNHLNNIYLLYSGGMDSEYVFNVFLHLGIKFTPVIIKLEPDYNHHDLNYALNFCKSKNIKPLVINLNFNDFVASGKIVEIAETAECCSFRIPATLHVCEMLDGFTVLGNDPPYMRLNPITNTWQLEEEELIHSILRYYKKKNLAGCPFILSYTSEMMLSFLLDPTMKKIASHGLPGKLGTNSSKVHVFNNGSNFNIPNRTKYTGYEKINNSDIINHENIKLCESFRLKWNGVYKEDYDDVVRRLSVNQ
jgi:hypothetical protein